MKKIVILFIGMIGFAWCVFAQETLINGKIEFYYDSGALKEEALYENGKLNGKAKKYYEDGTLYQEVLFEDGKPVGIGKIYYPTGQIEIEYLYQDGKKVGMREYDESGIVIQDTIKEKTFSVDSSAIGQIISDGTSVIELKGTSGSLPKIKADFKPQDLLSTDFLLAKKLQLPTQITAIFVPLIIGIIVCTVILYCIPIQIIASKTETSHVWLAYVPIGREVLMCWMTHKSPWLVFLFFIPVLGGFLYLIINVILWMGIAELRGKPFWVGLLVLIPVIGFFIPWYLALSD